MKNRFKSEKIILYIFLVLLVIVPIIISFTFYNQFSYKSRYTETLLAIFGLIYLIIASWRYSSYIKEKYRKEREAMKKAQTSEIEEKSFSIRKSQLFLLINGLFLLLLSLIVYLINK